MTSDLTVDQHIVANADYKDVEKKLREAIAPWRDRIKGPILADVAADALADLRKQRDEAKAEVAETRKWVDEIVKERLDEINAEAEAFDKDCWNTLKSLMQECEGFDWNDYPDGVTADAAFQVLHEERREAWASHDREKTRAESLRAENERLTAQIAGSSCCIEDGAEPCGPFTEMQIERDNAKAEAERLRKVAEGERERCINRLRKLQDSLDRTHTGPHETLAAAIEALIALPSPNLSSKED